MADASTTIHVAEDLEAFVALREEWDDLVRSTPGSSMFASWPWLVAAWRAAEEGSRPLVVLASDGTRLLAAAALQRRRSVYYRVPVLEISFLGDGLADRQEFLCRAGHAAAVADIWRFLAGNPWRADVLRLERIPDSCVTLAAGRETLARLEVEPSSVLYAMPMQGSWDDYLRNARRELRKDLRTTEKRLAEAGNWRIHRVHGPQIEPHLAALRALETAGYKGTEGKAFLADPRNVELVRAYVSIAAHDDSVLMLLEFDGRIAAYLLGFVHGATFHAYNMSFDESLRKAGPGKYVYAQAVQYAFSRRLAVMDFGSGHSLVKERLGGLPAPSSRAVLFRRGLKGSLLRLAVFRLRPRLQALLDRPVQPAIDQT